MIIMKRTVYLLAAALLLTVTLFANSGSRIDKEMKESKSAVPVEQMNRLQLTGTVMDKKSSEALAGATIVVDGKKHYADFDGNFVISDVKPGKYELQVELISYEPATVEVELSESKKLHIGLQQK